MWILMPSGGFISAVKKPDDEGRGTLTVRARVRDDLVELREHYLPEMSAIREGGGTDYPYRAKAKVEEFAQACAAMARAVEYQNYKGHVAVVKDKARANVYGRLWSTLLGLERP